MGLFTVRALEEKELPLAVEIINDGFNDTFEWLLGQVPPGRPEGVRVRERFHRPNTAAIALVGDRSVEGVCFLSAMGTRGVAGPLAIRPAYDTRIAARALMTATVLAGMKLGCKVIDSVTFPQSTTHLLMHFQFCEPLFPAPFVTKNLRQPTTKTGRARPKSELEAVPLSSLDTTAREAAIAAARRVTDKFTPGFDLSHDVRYVLDRKIGETLIVRSDDAVLGLLTCHYGERSEAFDDGQLLVKHVYVDPDALAAGDRKTRGAAAVFDGLLEGVEQIALAGSFDSIGLMVSAGRRTMLQHVLDRGYAPVQVHAHWAGRCPAPGQPIRSVGSDLASIGPEQFGATEMR